METPNETVESFKSTADSVAEKIMREYILSKYPDIQQLEAGYWTARGKLDDEMVKQLKQQTDATNRTGTDRGPNKPEVLG